MVGRFLVVSFLFSSLISLSSAGNSTSPEVPNPQTSPVPAPATTTTPATTPTTRKTTTTRQTTTTPTTRRIPTTTTPPPKTGLKKCTSDEDCKENGYICMKDTGLARFCIPKIPCQTHKDCPSLNCKTNHCYPLREFCLLAPEPNPCAGRKKCQRSAVVNDIGECVTTD
ncbi:unnamed protein product [Bursaphelenchus xylophilus]|nr:unnamed protein product [Bursaphelenchus xylophilus]CAG9089767.1 unnamed protein product [Bursaphelenchus xylophilus]